MIQMDPAQLADVADLKLSKPQWKGIVVQLARSPASVTLRDERGRVLAISGLYPHNDHHEAWLYLSNLGRRQAVAVILKLIDLTRGLKKVTVVVAADHAPGLKLAGLCGFKEFDRLFGGSHIRLILNP